jgi:hypothetical protein
MAVDLLLERRGNTLVPYDAKALEDLIALPMGKGMSFRVSLPRSISQHRWYWVELSNVVQATGCAPTAEHLHNALKLALGYTMPVFDKDKNVVAHIPDSTAFAKMPQHVFARYVRDVQQILAERFGYVMEVKHGPRNP